MGLKLLLSVVLDPHYFFLYLKLIFIFITLTFNGLVIFSYIFKSKNKYLNLGGGMIVGPLVLLLILSILSYIFKGPIAVTILFIIYTIICYWLFLRSRAKNTGQKKHVFLDWLTRKKSLSYWVIVLVTFIYISLIWLRAGPAAIGGDVETYWGIATSFARGNYPTVLPWQPNFLTVYHEGAFIVEGAIYVLSGMGISIVHTFFSAYMITAIFLFVTGMAREKVRSILCFTPAIFGLILFGGPIILIGGFQNFIFSNLSSMPQFYDLKGGWGSGANSLDSLYYFNYYTFGLAVFLLLIYSVSIFIKNKSTIYQFAILAILTVLCLSIAETLFFPALMIVAIFCLKILMKSSLKKSLYCLLILIIAGLVSFFVIQNVIRDSLLTPGNGYSRLELLMPGSDGFRNSTSFSGEVKKVAQQNGSVWFMASLPLIMLLSLLLSFFARSSFAVSLSASALMSSIFGYLVDNTFGRGGGIRFLNQSYELSMFALGFIIVSVKIPEKKFYRVAVIALIVIIFLPQTITANVKLLQESFKGRFDNYINYINFTTPTHEWIKNNIPYDKKIIFIDDYPDKDLVSAATLIAAQNYGFFVPTAPPDTKVISPDFGSEWYDAVAFLSPKALDKLRVDYVFIYYSALPRFSLERRKQLEDPDFFEVAYTNGEGILLKVNTSFKQLSEKEMTFDKIVSLIPEGKSVYLDKLPLSEMRRGLILTLANKAKLYGPSYSPGGDYFMYIETFSPIIKKDNLSDLLDIDYILVSAKKDISQVLGSSFDKIAENPYLTLWERVKK